MFLRAPVRQAFLWVFNLGRLRTVSASIISRATRYWWRPRPWVRNIRSGLYIVTRNFRASGASGSRRLSSFISKRTNCSSSLRFDSSLPQASRWGGACGGNHRYLDPFPGREIALRFDRPHKTFEAPQNRMTEPVNLPRPRIPDEPKQHTRDGLDHRTMRHEAIHTRPRFVPMKNPIWLKHNFRTRRNKSPQRIPFIRAKAGGV